MQPEPGQRIEFDEWPGDFYSYGEVSGISGTESAKRLEVRVDTMEMESHIKTVYFQECEVWSECGFFKLERAWSPSPPPKTSPVAWGQMLRYKTDDRDISNSELCIMQGGNGDWYVSVANGPDHYPTNGVRICTSGGAAVACPGLGLAISKAYNAMYDAQLMKNLS